MQINSTPLHYAAANGHIDLVQIFLLNEADVNAVNDVSADISQRFEATFGLVTPVVKLTYTLSMLFV